MSGPKGESEGKDSLANCNSKDGRLSFAPLAVCDTLALLHRGKRKVSWPRACSSKCSGWRWVRLGEHSRCPAWPARRKAIGVQQDSWQGQALCLPWATTRVAPTISLAVSCLPRGPAEARRARAGRGFSATRTKLRGRPSIAKKLWSARRRRKPPGRAASSPANLPASAGEC